MEMEMEKKASNASRARTGPTARPDTSAQPSAADLLRRARTELYSLCEATQDEVHAVAMTDTEGKMGAYARGRKVEAKGISRAMGEVFRELIAAAEEDRSQDGTTDRSSKPREEPNLPLSALTEEG